MWENSEEAGMMDEKQIRLDEREKIAIFLETHSIDWDCSHLKHEDDYDPEYCANPYDEFKAKAEQRMELADWVRKS